VSTQYGREGRGGGGERPPSHPIRWLSTAPSLQRPPPAMQRLVSGASSSHARAHLSRRCYPRKPYPVDRFEFWRRDRAPRAAPRPQLVLARENPTDCYWPGWLQARPKPQSFYFKSNFKERFLVQTRT